jgi:hypothetical protein
MLNYPVLVENEPTATTTLSPGLPLAVPTAITFGQTYQANPAIAELLVVKTWVLPLIA